MVDVNVVAVDVRLPAAVQLDDRVVYTVLFERGMCLRVGKEWPAYCEVSRPG